MCTYFLRPPREKPWNRNEYAEARKIRLLGVSCVSRVPETRLPSVSHVSRAPKIRLPGISRVSRFPKIRLPSISLVSLRLSPFILRSTSMIYQEASNIYMEALWMQPRVLAYLPKSISNIGFLIILHLGIYNYAFTVCICDRSTVFSLFPFSLVWTLRKNFSGKLSHLEFIYFHFWRFLFAHSFYTQHLGIFCPKGHPIFP